MRLLLPLALAMALALAAAAPAPVKADDDHDSALRLRERREILPLEELLRRLDLGKDVRILEIESEMEHGAALYEIEYVERNGRIRKIRVDARSGQVLGEED
jgi:uncharacterized membrane protein YkoI